MSIDNEVILAWVPGHSGIMGNEKADELARKGSSADFIGAEPAVARHASLMRTLVISETGKKHQERWEALTNCRQSKEFLQGCNSKNTKFLLSLGRTQLRKLIGVLTGHTTLNYHLNKIGITNDPTCRGCVLTRH